MKSKVLSKVFSLALTAMMLISIFSPAVMASTVYGPVQYEQGNGTPVEVTDSFSLNYTYGNYTLFIKNSDWEINRSSRASVILNGETVVLPKDFKQNTGSILSTSLSPDDLQKVDLVRKNVSLAAENNLNVKMKNAPGSQFTLWIEDESPLIKIFSPLDDTASNGTINVSGTVDPFISSGINLTLNGVTSALPVENWNFSTEFNLTETANGTANITISGTDSTGGVHSVTLLLDGDMLSESQEYELGFDPLNPDSDSSLTPENEAGNGILDGMETFENQLPSFVISRIGADPFVNDTDSDGLTDYFELTELGLLTDIRGGDSDGDGVPDEQEDLDNDGLTNLEEQTHGTDPLSADPDRDGLTDPQEISVGTNPRLADTDVDGLSDGSEQRLGANPLNPDSDGDGTSDGQESYVSSTSNSTLGVTVAVTGIGNAAQNVSINRVTSQCFTNISAVSGPVVDISLNESFSSANITIPYDPAKHSDYQNLGLFTYNETRGMFVQVPATVDPVTHTLTATTNHFSIYTVFHIPTWNSIFSTPMDFGTPLPPGDSWDIIFPFHLTSQSVYWFNSGSGFPAGSYEIKAVGRYNLDSIVSTYTNLWETGAIRAWENGYLEGIYLVSDPAFGPNVERQISTLTIDHYVGSASDPNRQAILRYNHPGGKIGLRIQEQPWTSNNNYGNLGYWLEYTGDTNIDDDGDGLNDTLETTGILSAFGRCYTNPNNPDTDGDGLPDGMETGGFMVDQGTGLQYFKLFSDPLNADSDGDTINDFDECELDTNPLSADTDGDGINDNLDQNPLSYDNNKKPGFSDLEIGRAIVLGAVFGECGIEGGSLEGYVDDEIASSAYYLVGWIGFSLIPGVGAVADARDAIQAFINGDELGAALNAAGAFSGVGDGVKVGAAVGLFIGKYPDKAVDVAKALGKYAFPHAPDIVKLEVLDIIFNGVASALNDIHKVPTNVLVELADKGVDLRKVKILLENVYNKWSPGAPKDPILNLDKHYTKHVIQQNEWGTIITKDEYSTKAINLINSRSGVEVYYQKGMDNMAVYDRTTGEFVTGNEQGIQTFFIPKDVKLPDGSTVNYVDNKIFNGDLIRLN